MVSVPGVLADGDSSSIVEYVHSVLETRNKLQDQSLHLKITTLKVMLLLLLLLNMGLTHVYWKWKWVTFLPMCASTSGWADIRAGHTLGQRVRKCNDFTKETEAMFAKTELQKLCLNMHLRKLKTQDRISVTIDDNGLASSPLADGIRMFFLKKHPETAVSNSGSLLWLQRRWYG